MTDKHKKFDSLGKDNVLHTLEGDEYQLSTGLANGVRKSNYTQSDPIAIDTEDDEVKSVRTDGFRWGWKNGK